MQSFMRDNRGQIPKEFRINSLFFPKELKFKIDNTTEFYTKIIETAEYNSKQLHHNAKSIIKNILFDYNVRDYHEDLLTQMLFALVWYKMNTKAFFSYINHSKEVIDLEWTLPSHIRNKINRITEDVRYHLGYFKNNTNDPLDVLLYVFTFGIEKYEKSISMPISFPLAKLKNRYSTRENPSCGSNYNLSLGDDYTSSLLKSLTIENYNSNLNPLIYA